MAACPQCRRPVAVARPSCLYCGAALDPALLPQPVATPAAEAAPAPPAPPAPLEERALLLIDASRADAETVARVLGLSLLEAGQRMRRGWQLHRVAPPAEAEAEAGRLRNEGLQALSLPEAETRAAMAPCLAEGGRGGAEAIELRTDRGPMRIEGRDVLLVVAGRIHRERQSRETARHRLLAPVLYPGYRFHLHLRADPTPIEIDPDAFAFDDVQPVPAATLVELRAALDTLALTIDEGFRFLPPALGVSAPPADRLSRALAASRQTDPDGPVLLDNLAQFRAYSGWRAALERRLSRG